MSTSYINFKIITEKFGKITGKDIDFANYFTEIMSNVITVLKDEFKVSSDVLYSVFEPVFKKRDFILNKPGGASAKDMDKILDYIVSIIESSSSSLNLTGASGKSLGKFHPDILNKLDIESISRPWLRHKIMTPKIGLGSSFINFVKLSFNSSKLETMLKNKLVKIDHNVFRDYIANLLYSGKEDFEKLEQLAEYIFNNNLSLVNDLGKTKEDIIQKIINTLRMFVWDIIKSKPRVSKSVYIRNILKNIKMGRAMMSIIDWIDKAIEDNKQHIKFVNFLNLVKEHYLRNFSKDPKVRATATSLDQVKNIISSVIGRHEELNVDLDALKNATESIFTAEE